ncbi:MAG TPA: hypothetical protein VGL92_05855 [Acidimicrobiia bacterium]
MAVELEPVALEPSSRREHRRVRSLLPEPGSKVSQRPRWRRFGALAAAVLMAVVAVGRLTGAGPAGTLHPEKPEGPLSFAESGGSISAAPPSLKPLSPGWRLVRRAPITSRHWALSTWTGRELLIWGGTSNEALADGAAYQPDTDQWRDLPPSPLGPREGASSAWTGREWIIWGGFGAERYLGDGAAYDPATGSWRLLPPAPIAARSGALAVWTGREVLIWGGSGPDGAAFDPETNRWRRLPRGGPTDVVGGAVWTGREMVAWEYTGPVALNPVTNRWRRLPLPPFSPWITRTFVWTGFEVLAVGGSSPTGPVSDGAAYDPVANRWRTLAPTPDPVDVSDATATWTGRLLVVARGPSRVQVYDPAEDAWNEMPGLSEGPRVGSVAAWTGTEMVFWGGYGVLGTAPALEEGVAWRP